MPWPAQADRLNSERQDNFLAMIAAVYYTASQ